MMKRNEYKTLIDECKSNLNILMEKIMSENLPEDVMREKLKKIKEMHNQFLQKIQVKCSHTDTHEGIFNGIRHVFCNNCLKTISVEKINK